MQKIVPFLWFDNQAEQAVNFYTAIFKGGKIGQTARYGKDTPGPEGQVMTVRFELAGLEMAALNGGPVFSFTPAVSFFVDCETVDEIDVLWARLAEGGTALMELAPYPFMEKFGWVQDRFGISWQLSLTREPQRVRPYLMFTMGQNGRAAEALDFYTSLFPDSRIDLIQRFGPDQDGAEGTVMHARFTLAGQPFMAMDGGPAHSFTFTPAISFFVNCGAQEEVDYFWEKLSEGGEQSQCGWLSDRFGVSWQIVPAILGELMSSPDAEKVHRVTQAMLKMTKLNIEALRQAAGEQ